MASARIVLLDAQREDGYHSIGPEDVAPHAPSGARVQEVLRLSDCDAPLVTRFGPRAAPVDWPGLGHALDRLLARLRQATGSDTAPTHTLVAGQGPLPLFALAGFELQRLRALTFVNWRLNGEQADALTLGADETHATGAPDEPFDVVSGLPSEPSLARGLVAVVVSTLGAPVERDALITAAGKLGHELAGVVQIHSREPLMLDARGLRAAFAQLHDRLRRVHVLFPKRDAIGLFVSGPATLAFLAGRAVSPRVHGLVYVPDHVEPGRYEPAFALPWSPGDGPKAGSPSQPASQPAAEAPATILYFGANPEDRGGKRLALDEEPRALRRVVEQGALAHKLHFAARTGARVDDIQRELNRLRPTMVHFGGHGIADGLILQRDADSPQLLSADALRNLLAACEPVPRIVLLNVCHSASYAETLAEAVDCVVGMPAELGDDDALKFALAFYDALAGRHSLHKAFEQGLARLGAHAIETRPVLSLRTGVDATHVRLDARDGA